jgi:hypothetical protein
MTISLRAVERTALVALLGVACYLLGRTQSPAPLLADSTANGNGKMIAVTGPYQQGVALLYVIDTETRQLAVYEARGGSRSSGRVSFVGARRIDLDLRLEGYHDDSEFSFADLAAQFRRTGLNDGVKVEADKASAEGTDPKKPTNK